MKVAPDAPKIDLLAPGASVDTPTVTAEGAAAQGAKSATAAAEGSRLTKGEGAVGQRLATKDVSGPAVRPDGQKAGVVAVSSSPGGGPTAPMMPANLGGPGKLAPSGSGAAQTPEMAREGGVQGDGSIVAKTGALALGAGGGSPGSIGAPETTVGAASGAEAVANLEKIGTYGADPASFPQGGGGYTYSWSVTASTSRVSGGPDSGVSERIQEIDRLLGDPSTSFSEQVALNNERLSLQRREEELQARFIQNEATRLVNRLDKSADKALATGNLEDLEQTVAFAEARAKNTDDPSDIREANQARATWETFSAAQELENQRIFNGVPQSPLVRADDATDLGERYADVADDPHNSPTIREEAAKRGRALAAETEQELRAAAKESQRINKLAKESGSSAAKRRAKKLESKIRKKWKRMNALRKKLGLDPLPYPGEEPEPPAPPPVPPPPGGPPPPPVMPNALVVTPRPDDAEDAVSVAGAGETPDTGNEPEAGGGGDPCASCKCDPPCPFPSECTCAQRLGDGDEGEGETGDDPGGDPGGGGGNEAPRRGTHARVNDHVK